MIELIGVLSEECELVGELSTEKPEEVIEEPKEETEQVLK